MLATDDDLYMEAIYFAAFLCLAIFSGWSSWTALAVFLGIDFVLKCRARVADRDALAAGEDDADYDDWLTSDRTEDSWNRDPQRMAA